MSSRGIFNSRGMKGGKEMLQNEGTGDDTEIK
jgi:hypothetical protein